MKILVITREFPPYVLGGISYHLVNLYNRISRKGHDVTVLSGKCRDAEFESSLEVADDIEVKWAFYPSIRAHHLQFPIVAKQALHAMDVRSFDIAISHTEYPFNIDIPVISKKHDCGRYSRRFGVNKQTEVHRLLNNVIEPTRRFVEKKSVLTSDFIIFNSNLTRNLWKEYYPIETNYTTVYNGVDVEIFYPRSDTRCKDYLLFVGGSERKGLSRIREFAPNSPYPIYLVGPDPSQLEIPNTRVVGRVTQEELARYYSGAVATLHPAKFEAFGNVILESLACGTPVVVSDQCGASEIVDSTCGTVTTDLIEGVRMAESISNESCVRIAREYSWESVAKKTIESINCII